jgi:hypothetical protein
MYCAFKPLNPMGLLAYIDLIYTFVHVSLLTLSKPNRVIPVKSFPLVLPDGITGVKQPH